MALGEYEITEATTLRVTVQINNADDSPRNLSGATFSATLGRGSTTLTGTVTVLDSAGGSVRVQFPAATDFAGQATASLNVTQSGETQTVWREVYKVYRAV